MVNSKQKLAPSAPSKRIALLDIFRGFALLGIYMVNIKFMSSSVLHPEAFAWMSEGPANQFTDWMLANFFNGKFYPIFSFLFGVGFGMQINKMEEKGSFSASFFMRRYFFLMLFGVVHVVFIWGGDVLVLYALAGFLVLLVRKIPVKYILIAAILILLFPFYGHLLNYASEWLVAHGHSSLKALREYSYDDIVSLNVDGTILDRLKFRLYEYTVYYRNVEYFPTLIFMIFGGYAAGRYKFYNKIPETLSKLTALAVVALAGILVWRFLYPRLEYLAKDSFEWYVIFAKLNIISNIAQSFLYLYIISFLYEKRVLSRLIEPLAYAGRMSLTNYITQSIIGMILFSGFYFGLYGRYNIALLVLISVVSYVLLIWASKIWTRNFRYGPLEFIWRELTYKAHLKFIKTPNNNQKNK